MSSQWSMRLVLAIVAIGATTAQAQNFYVRAGAGGNGSDWVNASSSLPSTLVRGATYYVADGSYAGYTFDDAHVGSTAITIKKATQSDHGSDTGWQAAYGDDQAIFSGSLTFLRGHYTIDGQTGGGPGSWEAGFGFKLNGDVSMQQFVDNNADFITLRHIDINVGQGGPNDVRGMVLYGSNNLSLQYVYLHDAGCDLISMNVMNNFLIEYSKLARNRQAEPGCHGDLIEYQVGDASNFVIRYNFFEDIVGSYAFGSHGPTITGYEIYGNVFYWTIEPFFGNGLVGCLSGGGQINNLKFYNNTLSGNLTSNVGNVGFGILRGSGNQAHNNIWHRLSGTGFSHGWGNTAHSTNTFYNGSGGADENRTGSPFINATGREFKLSAATSSGTTLGTVYNTDMAGARRGSDGTWDRGAFEFGGTPGGGTPDGPPVVSITAPSGGSTVSGMVTVSATASDSVGVSGVQFRVDGTNIGAEDKTAPYSTVWNTATATAGSHTLSAVARDSAGNVATATVTVTVAATGESDITTGLINHWMLDDGSGVTALDSAGGHAGTLRNGPVWVAGKSGQAISFDGVDDVVDLATLDVSGNALTIAAWIKADSFANSDARILSKSSGSGEQDHYFMLSTYPEGATKLRFRLKTGTSTSTLIAPAGALTTGQWIHVAAVYDGSAMILYKDAVEVGRLAKTGTLARNASVPVAIGRNPQSYGAFDGAIDDVRVYQRALPVADLQSLADATP